MKKTALLIIFLTSPVFAVTAVKDPIHNYTWWMYAPINQTKDWWVRYRYGLYDATNSPKGFCVRDVHIGRIYNGKFTSAWDANNVSGTWIDQTLNYTWLVANPTALSGGQAKLGFLIPAGHNRIHVIVQDNKSYTYTWSDGTITGLDVYSSYRDVNATANEIVIATNSTKNASIPWELRVIVTATESRVFGVHSWNTSLTGDPNTLSGDKWVGHDMIDLMSPAYSASSVPVWTGYAAFDSYQIMYPTTWDFVFAWAPGVAAQKWTAIGGHIPTTSGEAAFTLTQSSGPTLAIDGSAIVSLGADPNTIYQNGYNGSVARITTEGYSDYTGNSTHDANELTVREIVTIEGVSISNTVEVNFPAASEVAQFYLNSVEGRNGTLALDYNAVFPPAYNTKYRVGGDTLRNYPYKETTWLFPDNTPAKITTYTTSPLKSITFRDSSVYPPKSYMLIYHSGMLPNATYVGSDICSVTAGTHWSVGGRCSFGLAADQMGDFILWNDEQLTVNTSHNQGILYDRSRAYIISGGSISYLDAYDSSAVNISGGSVNSLYAYNSSTVTFYGQNFHVGSGLAFDGERVLGTGTLSGEWMDGTRWATNIAYNETTATILAITEPTHILTIDVDPNDVGIDTITPSVGAHDYAGRVNINAQQFAKCPDVYVFDHWEGDVNNPNSANTTVVMDTDKTITAVFVDGRKCGDECHPYPEGDVNKDCEVNFLDIAVVANSWLECTRPECD